MHWGCDPPAQVWDWMSPHHFVKDSGQCQRSKNCVPDIDARHAVCQQPCSRVWLNLNARVCPPTPSCPPPPPQLPKRRRRLPPNRPSTGGTTHRAGTISVDGGTMCRCRVYDVQHSEPVRSSAGTAPGCLTTHNTLTCSSYK